MAPEVIEGRPATEGSDVYGLGVVLYQMAIGDFSRALAPGWERDIADEVLREDIAACLDGDAARRLASARELATRLRGLERRRAERHARERGRVAAEMSGKRRRVLLVASAATLLLVVVGAFFLRQQRSLRDERELAEQCALGPGGGVAGDRRLTRAGDLAGAFTLAERAEEVIPTDPVLADRLFEISVTGTLRTDPPGARISVLPYAADAAAEWRLLGESPVAGVRLPRGVYRWRIEKDGYETVDLARRPPDDSDRGPELPPRCRSTSSWCPPERSLPAWCACLAAPIRLVVGFHLPCRRSRSSPSSSTASRSPTGSSGSSSRAAGTAGESTGPTGRARKREPASSTTPGDPARRPGSWEPIPMARTDLPVRGVSWHEAVAYCRFRGKSVPTVYHWARAAFAAIEPLQPVADAIIPVQQSAGDAPAPVGRYRGMAAYGAYDMAGNVKEWTLNATVDGRRYLLGGAWNEPGYLFF